MSEARRILDNCASMQGYHGTTTVEVVDEVLSICGGTVFCRGELREIVFTPITEKTFKFHTEGHYERHYCKS